MSKMTRRAFMVTAAAAAACASCTRLTPSTQPTTSPTTGPSTRRSRPPQIVHGPTTQPFPPNLQEWRHAYGKVEFSQRVRRPESKAWLPNPHIGTTTFQRFNGDPVNTDNRWNDRAGPEQFGPVQNQGRNDHYPQTTLAYCRWLWSHIEPQRGQYRWDFIDGALAAAQQRGQTLQMRLQPFIGDEIPKWFVDGGARFIKVKKYQELDHNTDFYVQCWGDLIRAFGQRYDGHPALESFDIAYGGACGETGGNATPQTAARLVDVYLKAFSKTQLVSMLGTPGCRHASTVAGRSIGWRADCFGDMRLMGSESCPAYASWNHMFDEYPAQLFVDNVQDAWKQAPITFETCGTVGGWLRRGYDIDFILSQGLNYHTSVFMPKSCAIPDAWADKIDAFNRRLGYRFVLRQMHLPLAVRPGLRFPIEFWIENVGVAPIYRPYRLALRVRQDGRKQVLILGADIRTWMPGHNWLAEEITLPAMFTPGTVALDLAIVDAQTLTPRIQFAIEGRGQDGWYPMTFLDIDLQATTQPMRDAETGHLRDVERPD